LTFVPKTIAIIASMDTKGTEAMYVSSVIRDRGYRVLMIDVGVMRDPSGVVPDVPSQRIARAGGIELSQLRSDANKTQAMEVMTRGASIVAAELYGENHIDAVLGLGGGAGTVISTSAMRALPIGVPKVMVSTVAAADTRPYIGQKDITMMYPVVDIAGLNRITARILTNAAGAVVGMLDAHVTGTYERPLIAASMFGNTTACVDRARAILDASGFEVLVFHATGTGGRTMESLIADSYIDGVLDITTTELADELLGGVLSAGPDRLNSAPRNGTPQIIAPGCLDMVNFWAPETVPERFVDRTLFNWNPNVTLMRVNIEESAKLGSILAAKVNQSTGPAKVLLPLRGISQLDRLGEAFWHPAADEALFHAIKNGLRKTIPLIEIDAHINDAQFADRAAHELLALLDDRRG
jgi:uncharacterized protein (UPF0261 family)